MTVLPRRSFSENSLPFSSGKVNSGALSWTFMPMSPAKSKPMAPAAKCRPGFPTILYRSFVTAALLAFVTCLSANVAAQDDRPLIVPSGDRRIPTKKDNGPRAIAVLQVSANNKSSLLPIAILIEGKFWDATAYKADPVPMALESGTVYEVERDGRSVGLFTVSSALHSNAPNADSPWLGTGVYTASGTDLGKKTFEAATVPVGIDTADEPPRLTKNPNAASSSPSSGSTPASGTTPAATPSTTPPSKPSGDEPPRLTKSAPPAGSSDSARANPPTGTQSGGTPSTPIPTSPSTPAGDTKPADQRPADSKAAAPPSPASDSGASASGRPRLRRGAPTKPLPDEEDVPGYTRIGSSSSSTTTSKNAAAPAGRTPIEIIPAISDAAGPEPHSFGFQWVTGEEEDRRKQIIALAKDQVRAYLTARAKAITTAKAPPARTTVSKSAVPKLKDPILDDAHMTTYDLWLSNQPVIVFSANAHMPPPPAGAAHSAVQDELVYSVLLVAYPDIYNNLHKLYAGVTDKFHLDVTPRLELIDALDADGDGRGELLFKKTTDAGTGWVIYRPTADKLYKMFDSLNPE